MAGNSMPASQPKRNPLKNFLKYSLLVLALAMGTTARAHAFDKPGDPDHDKHWDPDPPPGNNVAPEVDPGMAISGLSLLGGTLVILRARRRRS